MSVLVVVYPRSLEGIGSTVVEIPWGGLPMGRDAHEKITKKNFSNFARISSKLS